MLKHLFIVISVSLLAVACGGGNPDDKTAADAPKEGAAATDAPKEGAAATDAPKDGAAAGGDAAKPEAPKEGAPK